MQPPFASPDDFFGKIIKLGCGPEPLLGRPAAIQFRLAVHRVRSYAFTVKRRENSLAGKGEQSLPAVASCLECKRP